MIHDEANSVQNAVAAVSPKPRSSRRQFPLGPDVQLNVQAVGELTLARLQALLGQLLKQCRWAEKQGMSIVTFEAWLHDAAKSGGGK